MADDNSTIQQMRDQLKEQAKRIKELESYESEVGEYRKTAALRDLGFDPESKQGKALLKLHDGEMTADALRETADSYGITAVEDAGNTAAADSPLPQATQDRIAAQQVMNDARSTAVPTATGQRMSFDEFKQLAQTDGRAAQEAYRTGQVEVPSHVANQLAVNKQTSPLGR